MHTMGQRVFDLPPEADDESGARFRVSECVKGLWLSMYPSRPDPGYPPIS
jgi:hypothetical protein